MISLFPPYDFERSVTESGQGHDSLVARCATSSASSNRCECLRNGFQLKGGRIHDAEVFFGSFVFSNVFRIQSLNSGKRVVQNSFDGKLCMKDLMHRSCKVMESELFLRLI